MNYYKNKCIKNVLEDMFEDLDYLLLNYKNLQEILKYLN